MYKTFGLRAEDFRTQWPHQLKVLMIVSAELQSQSKTLHECSVANTTAAVRELEDSRCALEKETVRMIEGIKNAHIDSINNLLDASEALRSMFRSHLTEHAKREAHLQARFEKLSGLARELQLERSRIMSLPWWRRIWLAISPKPQ